MKIKSIEINNYKSFKGEKNTIYLEDNVTAIIGKNESGKSNVLEAVGNLHYYRKKNDSYFQNKNRSNNKEISVVITLQFTEEEYEKYSEIEDFYEETYLKINAERATIYGGLSNLIFQDKKLEKGTSELLEICSLSDIWDLNRDKTKTQKKDEILSGISNYYNELFFNPLYVVRYLKNIIKNSHPKKEKLADLIDQFFNLISEYLDLLPKLFYRSEDQNLKSYYDIKEIEEVFKQKSDIFNRFLQVSNISQEELLAAFDKKNRANKISTRRRIEKKVEEKIQVKFNEFYTQEEIEFGIVFEDNALNFTVTSSQGEELLLSERSNGLKWYISLFIDVIADNYSENNTVFLLDEPGVYLHVNAQKELLNFFEDLSKNGNQVVYTTHLPTMIDIENMKRIRVVDKLDGSTSLFNSYYDSNIPGSSKRETLSPLLNALGMNLNYNVGFQYDKNNIITEGITDYLYIKSMLTFFSVLENNFYLIPSIGAPNIANIAMILQGWGLKYTILFDYDPEGYKEFIKLTKNLELLDLLDNIKFVNGKVPNNKKEVTENRCEIEDLIDEKDLKKLSNKKKETSKSLVAKEFFDKVTSGLISPEESTVENFDRLFKRLDILNIEGVK